MRYRRSYVRSYYITLPAINLTQHLLSCLVCGISAVDGSGTLRVVPSTQKKLISKVGQSGQIARRNRESRIASKARRASASAPASVSISAAAMAAMAGVAGVAARAASR